MPNHSTLPRKSLPEPPGVWESRWWSNRTHFLARNKGKLIAIEGIDGSGKHTQTQLLLRRLRHERYRAWAAASVQYGRKAAGLIEEYLNGKYGKPSQVSPYAASLFYAVDRFDQSRELWQHLRAGYVVVMDRYVDSNTAHQGGKIKNASARKKFLRWLYDLEYRILGIPRPDLTLILRIPPTFGQRLVSKKRGRRYLVKGRTHDVHEASLAHLSAAAHTYHWLARTYPKRYAVVECVVRGRLLSPREIHGEIWERVKRFLG